MAEVHPSVDMEGGETESIYDEVSGTLEYSIIDVTERGDSHLFN